MANHLSYRLENTPAGLVLAYQEGQKVLHYRVDFAQGKLAWRGQHCLGRNELIIKAIGWKAGQNLKVIDATAGLGQESFLMATVGCDVLLFERHPLIFRLLADGLARGKSDPNLAAILERMHLHAGSSLDYLQQLQAAEKPDVIYCDPMFEAKKKSALVKKEMQLLQGLIGEDPDSAQLVALALQRAKKRVVVKRAKQAPLLAPNPSLVFSARNHRFDVYCLAAGANTQA